MSVITLTINEELISAKQGQSLLEVIRDQKIPLPTLCHLKGIKDIGACRLCIVEVEGSSKLLAACVTKAVEGQVVRTQSERLERYRKQTLELLLSERTHVCAVCVMNGNCELQRLAAELGVTHVRYDYLSSKHPMDATHERFAIDHDRCILCRRCVRVCNEVEGAHTWDVAGRGVSSHIISDLAQPWGESDTCTDCGKCVQACPVGALIEKRASASEEEKEPEVLDWLLAGRTEGEWRR